MLTLSSIHLKETFIGKEAQIYSKSKKKKKKSPQNELWM